MTKKVVMYQIGAIRLYIFILVLTIPLSMIYLDLLIEETSKSSAYKSVERDLEIVRPYITDHEYHLLRSEFRLMDNRTDVDNIYKKINTIGNKNNVRLPKKFLIGIN